MPISRSFRKCIGSQFVADNESEFVNIEYDDRPDYRGRAIAFWSGQTKLTEKLNKYLTICSGLSTNSLEIIAGRMPWRRRSVCQKTHAHRSCVDQPQLLFLIWCD